MRWLLFAISLVALWFAFNLLFMVPGNYSATTFGLAGAGIVVGAVTAWLSGKRFAVAGTSSNRLTEIVKTPPMVLCIFILCIFCAIGVVKFLAYR
jgi:hypothetical protein